MLALIQALKSTTCNSSSPRSKGVISALLGLVPNPHVKGSLDTVLNLALQLAAGLHPKSGTDESVLRLFAVFLRLGWLSLMFAEDESGAGVKW